MFVRRFARLIRVGVLALLLSVAVSPHLDGQSVARIDVVPKQVAFQVGDEIPFTVRAFDAQGNEIENAPLRIARPRQALDLRDGILFALEQGRFEIVVTAQRADGEPLSLTVPVVVTYPAVTTVTVAASDDGGLYAGTTIRHTARAYHGNGTQRPNPNITWTSSDRSVATVDAFGNATAVRPGSVNITASIDGVNGSVRYTVRPFSATRMNLEGGVDEVRTGDVMAFRVVAEDANGQRVDDLPITWSHSYSTADGVIAPSAPGQVRKGRFVADQPGVYTVLATAGPLTARHTFRATERNAVQEVELVGHARQSEMRTTDFWVFEGLDGRDYVITGSKVADGHAFIFDVTDPGSIVNVDSVQVDARTVNDVKVSPDGRYASVTREGASNRRNGVVLLDLSTPAHPKVAASFDDGLTGGVHNAFPTNDYLFALSGGDKYVIIDVRDIYNPRFVSEYNHPDSRVHDVWVYDGIAYSAEWETGVVAVDVGNGKWGGTIEHPVFITSYPVPSQRTHAVFPYYQENTGKFYLFLGDEIMNRRGLALGQGSGDYQLRYDPETGRGGVPLYTRGYIQVVDFTDPEQPEMVARYEVSEYGSHNIWVEDEKLFQAYYEGGLRVVDVSGELMGNLYTQGREIAVYKSADPVGYVANAPMVWSAMPFKGHVFFTDTNSGVWAVKIQPTDRPVM